MYISSNIVNIDGYRRVLLMIPIKCKYLILQRNTYDAENWGANQEKKDPSKSKTMHH